MHDPLALTSESEASRRNGFRPVQQSLALLIIGAGLIEVVAYLLAPSGFAEWIYNIGSLAFVVFMLIGVFKFRRADRAPWLLIVAGQVSSLSGDFLWAYYEQVLGIEAPYPSVPDVLYLLSYPLLTAGVVLLLRRMLRGSGVASLLDALIITTSVGLWVWVYLVTPAVSEEGLSFAEQTVGSAYPLADVLLAAVLVVFALRSRRPTGSLVLVGLAISANLAADVVYGFQVLGDQYATGDLIDGAWLMAYPLMAAAAFWNDGSVAIAERGQRLTTGRLIALSVAAALAPGIVIRQQLSGGEVPILAGAVVSACLFALAIARLALFNRELDQAKAGLEASQLELTSTLTDLKEAQHDRRLLLDRISRAAEEQRSQLAAELHDRPIQHLTALSYRIQRASRSLERGEVDKASGLLADIATGVSSQIEELRTLMTELRPPILDERGLIGALTDRATALNLKSRPVVEVSGRLDRIVPEVETHLFRIASEALANAVRHAKAGRVEINVAASGTHVCLRVEDDGIGFDIDLLPSMIRQGHFGLAGMRERVELLGGTATVESSPGGGTTLFFEVPLSVAQSDSEWSIA